jgi:hypothetical protein
MDTSHAGSLKEVQQICDDDSETYEVSPKSARSNSELEEFHDVKNSDGKANSSTLLDYSDCLVKEDITCDICCKLVVSAVQLSCCGALGCRTCAHELFRETCTCPFCQTHTNDIKLMPDKRTERKSCSHVRSCSYQGDGCQFMGNREEVLGHEKQCEFVSKQKLIKLLTDAESKNEVLVQLQNQKERHDERQREYNEIMKYDRASDFWYPMHGTHVSFDYGSNQEWVCKLSPNHSHSLIIFKHGTFVSVLIKYSTNSNILISGLILTFLHPRTSEAYTSCKFPASTVSKLKPSEEIGFRNVMTVVDLSNLVINGQFHVTFDRC